jgi:hypothetical protein
MTCEKELCHTWVDLKNGGCVENRKNKTQKTIEKPHEFRSKKPLQTR